MDSVMHSKLPCVSLFAKMCMALNAERIFAKWASTAPAMSLSPVNGSGQESIGSYSK